MTAWNYLSNGFFFTGVGLLPRLLPHGLPQRRLWPVFVRRLPRPMGQQSWVGQPRRWYLHWRVLQVRRSHRQHRFAVQRSWLLRNQLGGDLYIVNSLFANNWAGVVPNSGSYELCYPSRDTTIVGNIVHDNNYMDGDGIDVSLLAQGNGILAAGAVRATIERNLVYNHELTGIGLVPFPEEDANDLAPTHDKWDQPARNSRFAST